MGQYLAYLHWYRVINISQVLFAELVLVDDDILWSQNEDNLLNAAYIFKPPQQPPKQLPLVISDCLGLEWPVNMTSLNLFERFLVVQQLKMLRNDRNSPSHVSYEVRNSFTADIYPGSAALPFFGWYCIWRSLPLALRTETTLRWVSLPALHIIRAPLSSTLYAR